MPFLARKHGQCAQNGIVFHFQVEKLKFYACNSNTDLHLVGIKNQVLP